MTREQPDRAAWEPPAAGTKRLVLVVHGLGDNAAGETLRSFGRAVAMASGCSRVPTEEVLWLEEGAGRQLEEFPCHLERLQSDDGSETVLAEVYWASLSRLGDGLVATLTGFFRLIFGLHQAVARHATKPARSQGRFSSFVTEFLQKLSLTSAYVLRGPAAAAMLVMFACWFVGGWVLAAGGDSVRTSQDVWTRGIFITVGFLALATGLAFLRRWRGRLDSALYLWLALIGGALLAGSWWWLPPWSPESALDEAWTFGLMLAQWPAILVGLLTLLAWSAWAVAWMLAWRSPVDRPPLSICQAANFLVLGVWVVAVQYALTFAGERLPEVAVSEAARAVLDGVGVVMVYYWIFALIGVLVFAVALAANRRWAASTRAQSYRASRPAPRLLLARGFVAFLLAVPILMAMLQLGLLRDLMVRFSDVLATVSRFLIPLAVLIGGILAYSSATLLRPVFDFGLDFVSHFEGWPKYVRRQRIRRRLRIVLKTLVRREGPDTVTVLAHSQGTIVAAEVLAEDDAADLLAPKSQCDLVTMGSPFHHVYQRYFPNDYPPLSDARWRGLRQRVDRWYNIFRIDDPVGADIEPGGEWPENCPVDPGGHTGYWRDRQVLEMLLDRQLV